LRPFFIPIAGTDITRKGERPWRDPESPERVNAAADVSSPAVDDPVALELEPEQPAPVAAAVARLLEQAPPAADPWWRAGLEEALGA
jgi:hypothetical protein